MYERYWNLTTAPFNSGLNQRTFYESQAHEEALARLLYCVEQDKALAVLYGPEGCGKSQLLRMVFEQTRRTQRFVVALDLAGLSDQDLLQQLAERLRFTGPLSVQERGPWRTLQDFFQCTAESGLHTVLVLDGLNHAHESALNVLKRLLNWRLHSAARLTLITGTGVTNLPPALAGLLELADLCVEVRPLDRQETKSYVQERLKSSGSRRSLFVEEALDQVQELTQGVPREINRLCDLALLAGMNESRTQIERDLIDQIADEWKPDLVRRSQTALTNRPS